MIWILVQVHRGIADGVEVFQAEDVARQRVEELLRDFNWTEDNLNLFVGEVGSEFEEVSVEMT